MGSLITELERAHLDPARPNLARARRIAKGALTGREAWERLSAEGLVPAGERFFRVTERELARAGHRPEDLRRINLSHASATARSFVLPHPGTPESAVAYASVEVLALVEQHAREYLARIDRFRFLFDRPPAAGVKTPIWRILGSPLAHPADGPDLCDVEGAHVLAELARQLAGTSHQAHGVTRFFAAHSHATAFELWARAERPIPAVTRLGHRPIQTPQQMIRMRLAHFPNPFEPLVQIWRLGIGIRRLSQETILLHVPHLASASAKKTRVAAAAEDELRRAVVQADAPRMIELLSRGVDPNAQGPYGTALHLAVMSGHRMQSALLSELLEAGADPDAEDNDGMTPLALAVARDERRLATVLMDLGLDRDQRLMGGRTLLHVAARAGTSRMIELLIDRGMDPNVRCLRGRTPLHEVALSRTLNAQDAMRALIERGADPNARDRFGWTPLHHAATNLWGGTSLTELLLERGAKSLPDRGGRLPSDVVVHGFTPNTHHRLQAARGVANPLDPLPELPRHPDLEAAIQADPDDDSAWSVYADWLATAGDPRAELIQLGLAARKSFGAEKKRLLRAQRRAFEDRRVELLGELQRIHAPLAEQHVFFWFTFERGFLVRLLHRGTAPTLESYLTASSACFLRHLSAPGAQNVVRLLEAIGCQSLASLSLGYCATPLEQDLASALPRVRRLQLIGLLPRALAWPGLAELSFIATGARIEEQVTLDAHLPDLVRLRLVACDDVDRPRIVALARASLPNVRSLSFRGRAELFREITHAEWFSKLERLEVLRADDAVIARVEQVVAQRQNLRRIRLIAPHLATEVKRALTLRLSTWVPKARVS